MLLLARGHVTGRTVAGPRPSKTPSCDTPFVRSAAVPAWSSSACSRSASAWVSISRSSRQIRAVFFFEPMVAARDRVVAIQPGNSNQFSYLNYRDLLDSGVFESAIGHRRVQLNLRLDSAPERIDGLAVTPNFFEFLGVPMALGRQFSAVEAAPERQPRLAVLSYPFWQRRFGGDAAVIGRDIALNGESFAIVGVLPHIRPVTMFQDPDVELPISRLVTPHGGRSPQRKRARRARSATPWRHSRPGARRHDHRQPAD